MSGSGDSGMTCGLRKIQALESRPMGQASYGAYPWQAAIINPNNDQYIGAGVLVKDNYIITAAHKVSNL